MGPHDLHWIRDFVERTREHVNVPEQTRVCRSGRIQHPPEDPFHGHTVRAGPYVLEQTEDPVPLEDVHDAPRKNRAQPEASLPLARGLEHVRDVSRVEFRQKLCLAVVPQKVRSAEAPEPCGSRRVRQRSRQTHGVVEHASDFVRVRRRRRLPEIVPAQKLATARFELRRDHGHVRNVLEPRGFGRVIVHDQNAIRRVELTNALDAHATQLCVRVRTGMTDHDENHGSPFLSSGSF